MSEEQQRLCASCGNANPPDTKFCRECGAILVRGGSQARREAQADTGAPPDPAAASEATSRGGGRRWIGGMAALALVVLIGAAVFFFRGRRPLPELPVPGAPPTRAPASPGPRATPEARATAVASPARPEPSPLSRPTAPPRPRATPRTSAPPAAPASEKAAGRGERGIGGTARERPGWYRMRFRAPLFQEPSETAPIVTYLPRGTRIRVTRTLPGFLAVESVTGKPPGYVSSDDAVPEAPGPGR